MAVDFRSVRVTFDSTKGSLQAEPWSVTFGSTVKRATAVLNGFSVKYDNEDREVLLLQVDAGSTVSITGATARGTATLGLRDNSGSWDDPYSGWIDVTVIAEV